MIIVTGAFGFIGSNIVKTLNQQGVTDIIAVDDLTQGEQFTNCADTTMADYFDKSEFLNVLRNNPAVCRSIQAIFHEGACSDTMNWDGKYMMQNNYEYSKQLLEIAQQYQIPFLYASSAAVYGGNETFVEDPSNEAPLNVYGYSKLLFDQYVRRILPNAKSQIVGLRYFNVYGPREQHKGRMASVAFHFNNQLKEDAQIKLFSASHGVGDGEHHRDFVFVDDVVEVNLWFMNNPDKSGIFNVGTGRAQAFNDVADAVIAFHGRGEKTYIPMPEKLSKAYQSYTQADLTRLRSAGYTKKFKTVAEGVVCYLDRVSI